MRGVPARPRKRRRSASGLGPPASPRAYFEQIADEAVLACPAPPEGAAAEVAHPVCPASRSPCA